ncbi:MAG: glycerate kinase [Alkalibacterium sp.]|nr:glycerate kinase [Alkalibacterium sp.]
MKIVIAPDSFKESLTALEAAQAIEEGMKKVFIDADFIKVPMADGGEGTVQSVIDSTGGSLKTLTVTGPLNTPVEASYGLSGDKKLAVIEMASSSGLDKVPFEKRNPLVTTTYGFGELITDALDEGAEEILLGIGGSATNDGGAGMIKNLGGRLLDVEGNTIPEGGQGLKHLAQIDVSGMHPRLKDVTIRVACDVDNPLTGKEGASYIYGPQKGGTPEQLKELDKNLTHFAVVIKEQLGIDIEHVPGSGAAGGLGAGIMAFLDGNLENGGELLVDILELDEKVKDADFVITGEGGINHQTIYGKTPVAVSRVALRHKVPVIAMAGSISEGYESVYEEGIQAVFSVVNQPGSLEVALENGYMNLKKTAENVARVIQLGKIG